MEANTTTTTTTTITTTTTRRRWTPNRPVTTEATDLETDKSAMSTTIIVIVVILAALIMGIFSFCIRWYWYQSKPAFRNAHVNSNGGIALNLSSTARRNHLANTPQHETLSATSLNTTHLYNAAFSVPSTTPYTGIHSVPSAPSYTDVRYGPSTPRYTGIHSVPSTAPYTGIHSVPSAPSYTGVHYGPSVPPYTSIHSTEGMSRISQNQFSQHSSNENSASHKTVDGMTGFTDMPPSYDSICGHILNETTENHTLSTVTEEQLGPLPPYTSQK